MLQRYPENRFHWLYTYTGTGRAIDQSHSGEQENGGIFQNLSDFIDRMSPGIEQINILIRVGAFRFTGKSKKELLWEANFLHKKKSSPTGSGFLFREELQSFHLPELRQHPLDDALDEIEILGFPSL